MYDHHIENMVRRLKSVVNSPARAKAILERYWSDKIAVVWSVDDVFKAANECDVALTKKEAIKLLQELHTHHNAQYGIKWEDITTYIENHVLGRKLTKAEVKRFVNRGIITINK